MRAALEGTHWHPGAKEAGHRATRERIQIFVGGNITDTPFPVAQPGTSLLTLMGFRLEGIFPAALLPLLLTMILFLGPLMQLSMDCPCDLTDGLKVVLGESSRLSKSPSFLGPLPHRHALATKPSYSTLDRGAGVPGLYAAHASTMHRSGPCCVHLPTVFWSR